MIDKLFEALTSTIERVLAIAFVFAVCINFANVVGRYGFGHSFLGADEVQIYIMVCMAFLGAAIVSWRNAHLRMDVLVRRLPGPIGSALRLAEIVLVALLSGLVLIESSRYTAQMFALERKSDNAGIPMWVPHGAVTLGFGLIALIAVWRGIQFARGVQDKRVTAEVRQGTDRA